MSPYMPDKWPLFSGMRSSAPFREQLIYRVPVKGGRIAALFNTDVLDRVL